MPDALVIGIYLDKTGKIKTSRIIKVCKKVFMAQKFP